MPYRLIALCVMLTLLMPAVAGAADLRAPDWTLNDAQGNEVTLSETVRDQPVVVLFWASWCPYCKALMPHLQSLKLEYGEELDILAINFRDKGDAVAFIENAGYDFIVLPAGDDVASAYQIWGTPGVLLIDSEQKIRFDLRALPRREPPLAKDANPGHRRIAAYRAPYWAAEIRRAVDTVLEQP